MLSEATNGLFALGPEPQALTLASRQRGLIQKPLDALDVLPAFIGSGLPGSFRADGKGDSLNSLPDAMDALEDIERGQSRRRPHSGHGVNSGAQGIACRAA